MVKKPHTSPARKPITLGTDAAFDGSGTFTRSSGAVRFFTAAAAGLEITFNGTDNVFPPNGAPPWAPAGSRLSGGVTVYAEGASPSAALNDITITLHLSGGSKPVGPDRTSTITSVELTLDICRSRTAAESQSTPPGDPAPMSQADKVNVGRYLHIQDAGRNHGRALVIVQRIRPAAFSDDLELRALGLGALDGKVELFAADLPRPAPAAPPPADVPLAAAQTVTAASLPKQFWAQAKSVSGALNDTGFQLGIKNLEPDGDRVKVTCVQFTQIQAKIKSTPPNTARVGYPLPADHTFLTSGGSEDFAATPPLVLMRNAQPDIALVLTASPAALPVVWKAIRNPDDNAALGGAMATPTVTQDAADRLKATLNANQRGSFRVRPFIDCNGSGQYEDGEPSIPLNLILADAEVVVDRTAAHGGVLTASITPAGVRVANGAWAAGAVLNPPDLAAAACGMDLDAKITGGGSDGRLGLNRVFAGFINNLRDVDISAVYRDATGPAPLDHVYQNVYVSNLASATGPGTIFQPGDPAPLLHAFPILDTGRSPEGIGGDTAVMGRSDAAQNVVNLPLGQQWTIRCIDSPARFFAKTHPIVVAAVLRSIHYRHRFTGYFCFWTNVTATRSQSGDPADRVYSSIRSILWDIVGDWDVAYPAAGPPGLVATTPHSVTAVGANISPIGRAQDNGVEVRPPSGIASVISWDARA